MAINLIPNYYKVCSLLTEVPTYPIVQWKREINYETLDRQPVAQNKTLLMANFAWRERTIEHSQKRNVNDGESVEKNEQKDEHKRCDD